MKTSYKIKRIVDGKFARQTRFYGATNWGVGQEFIREKAALSNFDDLIYKREHNFPWGEVRTDTEYSKLELKSMPKFWGKLQLIKYESVLKDKDLMETRMTVIKEA
jgi:hypothetical protein